jgi:hypothetical protein
MLRIVVIALLFNALAGWARGQDIVSGPTRDAKVPALKVYDATGEHKEKEVDYAAQRKDKPTVYLFIDAEKFDRPMNRFMKTLDGVVKKDFDDTYVVAVWLTGDADKTKALLPRVQQSVQYEATALTLFADRAGPKDWNLNADAHLTVVIASKGVVRATFGYRSVNETDVPAVKEKLAAAIGKK